MNQNIDFEHFSVAKECKRLYKDLYQRVQECKANLKEEIITGTIELCDLYLEELEILKKLAKSGGQKQSCYYTTNLLTSLKDDLNGLILKQGGNLVTQSVKWMETEAAFQGSIRTGMVKNLKHVEIKSFLQVALSVACKEIKSSLGSNVNSMKVYTVLMLSFELKKSTEITEKSKYFNTKAFPIFQTSDVTKLFSKHVTEPLLRDVEEFMQRGSGWTLKKIEFLNIVMNKYNPLRASSYIPLPEEIKNKHACINVQNVDEECFKWAMISALVHYKGYIINNPSHAYTYEKYVKEFDPKIGDLTFPIAPGEVFKFQKLNDVSINLYVLKKRNGNFEIFPIQLTAHRGTKKYHVNLLLVEKNYPEEENCDDFNVDGPGVDHVTVPKRRKSEIICEESVPEQH